MWRGVIKTAAATAVFCALHSAAASPTSRRLAVRFVGRRRYDAGYRLFYNAQAVATFAALVWYIRRQPDRELYHVRGAGAMGLRLAQGAGVAGMVWAIRHVGPFRLAGFDGPRAEVSEEPRPAAAVGQGPERNADGSIRSTGPFRLCRHPLNAFAPWILWFNPRMTANFAAFNAVATAYFVVGSWDEERRLSQAFGEPYRGYLRSGVPFLIPVGAAIGERLGKSCSRGRQADTRSQRASPNDDASGGRRPARLTGRRRPG